MRIGGPQCEMSDKETCARAGGTDFSIHHILNYAGTRCGAEEAAVVATPDGFANDRLHWLQCTRFCPPRVPRRRNGAAVGGARRQLGRHPRIPFTGEQLAVLEAQFKTTPYLSSAQVSQLAQVLALADIRIKIWFQNRRARERREQNQQPPASLESSSPEAASPTSVCSGGTSYEEWSPAADEAPSHIPPPTTDAAIVAADIRYDHLSIWYHSLFQHKQS